MKLTLFLLIFLIQKGSVFVPKYKLQVRSPLANYKGEINNIKISIIEKMEFYSLSIPIGGQKKAETAIKKAFNCQMPLPGDCSVCREYKVKILRLSKDHIFLYFGFQDIIRIEKSLKVLEKSFYVTEKSKRTKYYQLFGTNMSYQLIY